MGGSIPFACQDWANTKAAYRFFSNPNVEVGDILNGHFAATAQRYDACNGPILVLQDTTEFTYQRRNPHEIGFTFASSVNSGRDKKGRLRHHAVCGILMHSSLAVTLDGLPLGLAAVKFWNRDKFKGTAQLKRKINPTRVPIEAKESIRWLENLRQSIDRLSCRLVRPTRRRTRRSLRSVSNSTIAAFTSPRLWKRYALSRWAALSVYIDDGRVEIDNNIAERAMRPLGIGRKNWLFAGSDNGGERIANILTIIETTKLHGHNPEVYLTDVLTRIQDHPKDRLEELLPWNMQPASLSPQKAV